MFAHTQLSGTNRFFNDANYIPNWVFKELTKNLTKNKQ